MAEQKQVQVDLTATAVHELIWKKPIQTIIWIVLFNFAMILQHFFHISFTAMACDFAFMCIIFGIILTFVSKAFFEKNKQHEEVEDDYKFVSEETVQQIVLVGYMIYKKVQHLVNDIVFFRDPYCSIIAFVILLAFPYIAACISDKVLLWLGMDLMFALTFLYQNHKEFVQGHVAKVKELGSGVVQGIIDKVPKYMSQD